MDSCVDFCAKQGAAVPQMSEKSSNLGGAVSTLGQNWLQLCELISVSLDQQSCFALSANMLGQLLKATCASYA